MKCKIISKILELCTRNLSPDVYETLDVGVSLLKRTNMRPEIQKLLARTFAKYSAKCIGKI